MMYVGRMRVLPAVILSLAAAGPAAAQSFNLLPPAPGSTVTGMSADGGTVTGNVGIAGAFIWTANSRTRLNSDPAFPPVMATYGMSSDGRTVVGEAGVSDGFATAFRWSGLGTYEALGVMSGYFSSAASGISGDASVVVGHSQDRFGFTSQAFRWTEPSGMQGLGYTPGSNASDARAISRDGSTIVGWSGSPQNSDAFVWRAGQGMQRLTLSAGLMLGHANAVNGNGRIIVGYASPTVGASTPVVWRDGLMSRLQTLADSSRSTPLTLTDDGSLIAGWTEFFGPTPRAATIWRADGSVMTLASYFATFGVATPEGWTLESCTAISSDGRTFGGTATNAAGGRAGFVASVPAPATGVVVFGAMLAAGRRVRRREHAHGR